MDDSKNLVVFEVDNDACDVIDEIVRKLGKSCTVTKINSLSAYDLTQIVVAAASLTASVATLIKAFYPSRSVTVKVDGIEVTDKTIDKVLQGLPRVLEVKAALEHSQNAEE